MTNDEQGEIKRSLQGDEEAFESLVRRYQRMIYAVTYRMTGSTADAEDLMQETFLRAHQQLHSFRAEAKFSSWLYRIAMNHCLNWRQRTVRREQVHAEWATQDREFAGNNATVTQRVQAALLRLDAKQRAAIVLTTCDGLSHAEAARVLGCAETTVSWRLFAARRKLKRLLQKSEGASDE